MGDFKEKSTTLQRRNSISDTNSTYDDDSDEERAKEIEGLQKRGILPMDFPLMNYGDNKYDWSDRHQETDELAASGNMSREDGDHMANDIFNQFDFDCRNDPHLADHEQMIPPLASDGIPLNWSRDPQKPSQLYQLVVLEKGEPEFDIIAEEFKKAHIDIKKIERLQNSRILDRFKVEMDDVVQHKPVGFNRNIRYLYHGTSVAKERICEEGLDQRLSRMGYFGKGIYFSNNPRKCVHYSDDPAKKNPDEAYILKCRVILGESKVYAPGYYDISLKREPEKENHQDGWRYYDSVVGCPKDYYEFVVYENRRAMIEYIISFKVDKTIMQQIRNMNAAKVNKQCEMSPETLNRNVQQVQRGLSPVVNTADDHCQRISEVREAVRKKRLEHAGKTYAPPSQVQQQHDTEIWERLQTVHKLLFEGNNEETCRTEVQSRSFDEVSHAQVTEQWSQKRSKPAPVVKQQPSETPEEQVLNLCIAEFLAVTDTDDSTLAKYFVQKANMDVNHAISLYYEEIG